MRSPIDYRSLEGVPSLRIHTSTDYAGDNYLIRWTEVFFLEVDENSSSCTIQYVRLFINFELCLSFVYLYI